MESLDATSTTAATPYSSALNSNKNLPAAAGNGGGGQSETTATNNSFSQRHINSTNSSSFVSGQRNANQSVRLGRKKSKNVATTITSNSSTNV